MHGQGQRSKIPNCLDIPDPELLSVKFTHPCDKGEVVVSPAMFITLRIPGASVTLLNRLRVGRCCHCVELYLSFKTALDGAIVRSVIKYPIMLDGEGFHWRNNVHRDRSLALNRLDISEYNSSWRIAPALVSVLSLQS